MAQIIVWGTVNGDGTVSGSGSGNFKAMATNGGNVWTVDFSTVGFVAPPAVTLTSMDNSKPLSLAGPPRGTSFMCALASLGTLPGFCFIAIGNGS
jgi:hypothetical protein